MSSKLSALHFTLYGNHAFFCKPDTNYGTRYTYEHIPKPTLLGLLGAILGYSGYSTAKLTQSKSLEFHDKLKHLKISISPNSPTGIFSKGYNDFVNTTGMASSKLGDGGRCLKYREQWLLDVSWDIYILNDNSKEFEKLKEALLQQSFYFVPYLGGSDHLANFQNIEVIPITKVMNQADYIIVDSLIPRNIIEDAIPFVNNTVTFSSIFPIDRLDDNSYAYEKIIFTHDGLLLKESIPVYMTPNNTYLYFL